jgi:glycosyltransferase involved in cell wall biosynthesis
MTNIASSIYLSIIIPARNEADRITRTLIELDRYLERVPFSYEIIVSEDGSKDETLGVVERMTRLITHLRVITPEGDFKKGKGAAIARGMLAAKGEFRLYIEADNAISIEHFMDGIFPLLRRNAPDIIVGSKVSCTCGDEQKHAMSFLENLVYSAIQKTSLPEYTHIYCGFKCFSADAAVRIFSLQKITGKGFDAEVLMLAKRLGYVVEEIGVICKNQRRTPRSVQDLVHVGLDAVRTRYYIRRNTYELNKEWKQGKFIF